MVDNVCVNFCSKFNSKYKPIARVPHPMIIPAINMPKNNDMGSSIRFNHNCIAILIIVLDLQRSSSH